MKNTDKYEIDIEAMQALYKGEKTKLSYEEWFATRLVDSHMGDDDALVYREADHKNTVNEDNTEDKKESTVLSDDKIMTATEVLERRDAEASKLDKKYGKSPVEALMPDLDVLNDIITDLRATGTACVQHTAENPQGERIDPNDIGLPNYFNMDDALKPGGNSLVDLTDQVADIHTHPDPEAIARTLTGSCKGITGTNSEGLPILSPNTDVSSLTASMFKLTDKQFQFCMEYIKDFNGARSIRDAGYTCKTVVAQSVQAKDNLNNPKVVHCMQQLQQLRRDRISRRPNARELAKDADAVVNRIAELASFDISDFMRVGNDGLPYYDFSEATPEQLRTIGGLKIKQGKIIEYENGEPVELPVYDIEIKDHLKASLDMLGKHHGIFTERVQIEDKRDMNVTDVSRRLAFLLNSAKAKKGSK